MNTRENPATRSPTATTATSPAEAGHDSLRALAACGAAVAQVGAALGLAEARLARAEGMDRLETTLSVPLEKALEWDARPLTEAFGILGDDLRIDLTLSGLDSRDSLPAAFLRAGRAPADALADFLVTAREMAAAQGEDVAVELRLAIGKVGALAALKSLVASRPEYLGSVEALAQTKLLVWYHRAGFERIARLSALADWERLGLARETGRTVIALCDAGGYLAGPALEVIGARAETPPRWLLLSRAAWRQFEEQCRRVRQLRDEESLWVGGPRIVTPAHLRLVARNPGLESLAAALAELHAGVAAAYLASSLHETADDLLLRFSGARPATCRLHASDLASQPSSPGDKGEPEKNDLTPQPPLPRGEGEPEPPWQPNVSSAPAHESEQNISALARFAAWAFEHGSSDKLVIARECLAGELPPGATVTLARVATAAGPAFEAARANLALYLRGRSLAYFQARQQAEDAVGAYTLGVRKGVSDLTTDVVNNVYATVGLLVGVVIAGLIQPRDSLPVQRLGAALYTAYVAFVLCFLLRARWQRYRLERAEVAGRLAAMEELSETERSRLRAQAGAADTHFEAYFALSRHIYIALACLGALYFVLLLTPLGPHVALPHGR